MLKEIMKTRQLQDENPRRWFADENMDLIVWFDDGNNISGFQLCYDKPFAEHALTWRTGSGFSHNRVDDGEGKPGSHKSTPLLVPDGRFNLAQIAGKFSEAAADLDAAIRDFICSKLLDA